MIEHEWLSLSSKSVDLTNKMPGVDSMLVKSQLLAQHKPHRYGKLLFRNHRGCPRRPLRQYNANLPYPDAL